MSQQRRTPFTKRLLLAAAMAVIASVLPLGFAAAQAPAPKQTSFPVPFRDVATPGTNFDVVQSVIDYNPGATASASAMNVANYLTVLEGELTIQVRDKSEVVAKGKGLSVPAGATLVVTNASGAKARLFVSTLLPVAAVVNVHQPNSSGVAVFSTARRSMSGAPAVVDVIQVLSEFDPGFRTPNHIMNEFHLFSLLTGITDFGYLGTGAVERFSAGQLAVMYEGMAGWMGNTTQEKASWAITWVGTPGKPLTSAVPAAAPTPAPPKTGSGLAQDGAASPIALGATGLILMFLGASAFAAKRARGARHPG